MVEPKIKALFSGTIKIETIYDEIVISIHGAKKDVKYSLRKSEIAKQNELAGISGRIEGKLYLPYKDGDSVNADESIVEIIRDGYNIPNRIAYGTELKVDDGDPIPMKIKAGAKRNALKFYKLKGDYLERINDIKKGDKRKYIIADTPGHEQ